MKDMMDLGDDMIYLITMIYFVVFIVFYLNNRIRLINGFLFMIFLLLLGMSMVLLADQTGSQFLFYLAVFLAMILLAIMTFSSVIIIVVTFVSSVVLIKREGLHLSNCLSLFSGILFFGWILLNNKIDNSELSSFMFYGVIGINAVVLYLLLFFANYVLSSIIYQFYIPVRKQDYIIVLGSGLMNGNQVTPLLAERINRAIQVYNRQKKHPILIMSGGQGKDETVPESVAMREYALKCGVDENHILVEDQSKNTYENLLFSKRIILNKEKNMKQIRILFSTTNYHVFRAGIYASKVKLNANGIGAPTKFYFWLNALLREFMAILMMNKKNHVICLMLCIVIVVVLNIVVKENLIEEFMEIILKFNG